MCMHLRAASAGALLGHAGVPGQPPPSGVRIHVHAHRHTRTCTYRSAAAIAVSDAARRFAYGSGSSPSNPNNDADDELGSPLGSQHNEMSPDGSDYHEYVDELGGSDGDGGGEIGHLAGSIRRSPPTVRLDRSTAHAHAASRWEEDEDTLEGEHARGHAHGHTDTRTAQHVHMCICACDAPSQQRCLYVVRPLAHRQRSTHMCARASAAVAALLSRHTFATPLPHPLISPHSPLCTLTHG